MFLTFFVAVKGFGYSGEHEEGTLVEGVPAFDMDQKRPNKKLTRQEAEALASKEGGKYNRLVVRGKMVSVESHCRRCTGY